MSPTPTNQQHQQFKVMDEFYIFNTEAEAVSAQAEIASVGGFPWTGKKKGKDNPLAQKVERYATPRQRVNDGKWYFPALKTEGRLSKKDLPPGFHGRNKHTVEELQTNWLMSFEEEELVNGQPIEIAPPTEKPPKETGPPPVFVAPAEPPSPRTGGGPRIG